MLVSCLRERIGNSSVHVLDISKDLDYVVCVPVLWAVPSGRVGPSNCYVGINADMATPVMDSSSNNVMMARTKGICPDLLSYLDFSVVCGPWYIQCVWAVWRFEMASRCVVCVFMIL